MQTHFLSNLTKTPFTFAFDETAWFDGVKPFTERFAFVMSGCACKSCGDDNYSIVGYRLYKLDSLLLDTVKLSIIPGTVHQNLCAV